ncbi:MAG: asparaginase [Lachnospiraceae bacterium]|nr:asparaginase [Lachnospiraceae bacterium]
MKKKILLLATGGTVASRSTGHGLSPSLLSEEILTYVPSIRTFCETEALQLFNIDSTNMEPSHWMRIAREIRSNYENFDGFVILHGTDTMSYTAAALSYLIQNTKKPIVLTGAQRPIDQEITDAKRNLYDSFLYACDPQACGVSIVFDGHVIAGTRARKIRTKSFNAFSSIDFPDLAVIRNNRIIRYILDETEGGPIFSDFLNARVFVLKLIPGMDASVFDYLKTRYDALVIESFGVGGIPCYGVDRFAEAVRDWVSSGKILVMTTQVPLEGSDMTVYQVGARIKEKYEVLEAYDMTLEAVVTKLMWILGKTSDQEEIRRLFYQSIWHDTVV